MVEAHRLDEAEDCRQRAHAYVGRPEATFLLRVAQEFERLALERRTETAELMVLPREN